MTRKSLTVRWGRVPLITGGVVLAIVLAVAVCEALGWPFLVGPMQSILSRKLDRKVSFSPDASTPAKVRIRLIGRIRLRAEYLEIGAPAWSQAPHMLLARDARLRLAYGDLWRAYRGEPLRIRDLEARVLDGQIERTADGRASWQFGAAPPADAASSPPAKIPTIDRLQVAEGTLAYRDAPLTMNLDARFSLSERKGSSGDATVASASGASSTAGAAPGGAVPPGLQFHGTGTYLKLPIRIDIATNGAMPILTEEKLPLPVSLDAVVGKAQLSFRGTATDVVHFGDLKGTVRGEGTSLAAVGDALKLTLPTTGPFAIRGEIAKTGLVWNAVIDRLAIGDSSLSAALTYDPRPKTPLLSGRLDGTRLALADLGPAVGRPVPAGARVPVENPSPAEVKLAAERSAEVAAREASDKKAGKDTSEARKTGKVLPDRAFDLPSLRAMNANVLVDIRDLDLGSEILQPLRPLRAHLVLNDAVLTIKDIEARTGQGRLGGSLQLDGRTARTALWNADLQWDDVRLDTWIHQTRKDGAPPYVSGVLDGRARLAGEGRSTAAILGSLKGGIRMNLEQGSVSHLAVEAAGLDLAQAIGVFVKGDDALPMQCAVADLIADKGVLTPRVMVVETKDSVLWMDGSVSLASEDLDLRMLVSPKDFSPLALRTPVHLKGRLADPSVSLEMGKLGGRVGAAALLALVTPVAAVIPFFDRGSSADARRGSASCEALMKRIETNPRLSPPGTRTPLAVSGQKAPPTPAAVAAPSGAPKSLLSIGSTGNR